MVHLLRFWQMDLSLPGVLHTLAVTVRQFKISSGVCSRFRQQVTHLLRFWKMDQWWPGVIETLVVTVRQFKISSGVCSRFGLLSRHLLRFWKMDPSWPGVLQRELSPPSSASPQVTTDPSSRIAAKAPPVAWICFTPLSWSWTAELSPP